MNIYVDLSHLMLWQGRMSGIERVEYNLVKHYLSTENFVYFVVWQESTRVFELCSKAEVEDLVSRMELTQQSTSMSNDSKNKKRFIEKLLMSRKKTKRVLLSAEISKEDKLLILDGLWDKQGYIESVIEMSTITNVEHIVYDMIPVLYPGYVLDFITQVFENYMKTILPLCKKIYVISKNTAKDTEEVLSRWGVDRMPLIIPFRLGDDVLTSSKSKHVAKRKGDFILATGTVEVRKNYAILLSVYGLAKEQNINLPNTYIVGKKGWLSDNFVYIIEHDTYFKDKIRILDNITDDELAKMYNDALFILCPSFYEGWGLPVRESLAYGKVTLASNTSSLPEAGQEFANYFSPHNPKELLSLMATFLNSDTRKKQEKAIAKGYVTYQWRNAAADFAAIVEQAD